jgi:hypothetical protein
MGIFDFSERTYVHKMDHRDQSVKKSQWSISKDLEQECFEKAMNAKWDLPEHNCWGLHLENEKAVYLGKTASSDPDSRQLFIAKFVDGDKNNKWHGYPADPCDQKQQDIPPDIIRRDWLDKQYFRATVIAKISRGKKCYKL